MTTPALKHHALRALLLYEQCWQMQQQPLISSKALARTEQQLMIHLHVLSFRPELWPKQQDNAGCFIKLTLNYLSDQQTDPETVCRYLENPETRQGAFAALCITPEICPFTTLQQIYQRHEGLRTELFDLWRLRRDKVPAGLVSAAELQKQNIDLQLAALNYASTCDAFGTELFRKYYQGLSSGQLHNRPDGKILACAFRGTLLRGSNDFIKPLWRAIETENDPLALVRLLEIGAIAGIAGIEQLIAQKAAQMPAVAARLFGLHGSIAAIDRLLLLPVYDDYSEQIQAVWQWLSGQHLKIEPHLRLINPDAEDNHDSARHWWSVIRPTLRDDQRLLFGQVMSAELITDTLPYWAGQFSRNLLPLLSWQQKKSLDFSLHDQFTARRLFSTKEGGAQ